MKIFFTGLQLFTSSAFVIGIFICVHTTPPDNGLLFKARSVGQHPLGACEKCRISGPILDLWNLNLQVKKQHSDSWAH